MDDSCRCSKRSTARPVECASLSYKNSAMNRADLFMELVATYRKHGWELKSALLLPVTRAELITVTPNLATEIVIKDSSVDALWFSRPSHNDRVAWELRLLGVDALFTDNPDLFPRSK